ncbi:MAG: N-acetyltransferase family protein [Actinomycetes bacterium]
MTETLFRTAVRDDVPAIVALLADDPLGATREDIGTPLSESYWTAFEAIDRDPNQLLVVGEQEGQVVATAQLSFLAGLSRRGAWRAQLEAVRVASAVRGQRVGEALVAWTTAQARDRGCRVVQLTSDRTRVDAHRFYERLGFEASHVGMKRMLAD